MHITSDHFRTYSKEPMLVQTFCDFTGGGRGYPEEPPLRPSKRTLRRMKRRFKHETETHEGRSHA